VAAPGPLDEVRRQLRIESPLAAHPQGILVGSRAVGGFASAA
jgi:hypothetical protein